MADATDEFADFSPAPTASAPADEFAGFAAAPADAPPTTKDSSTPFQDEWGAIKHQGAQLLKGGANAVAALPLMAEDFGVAARNVVGDAANKAMGNPSTPDYELPSTTFHNGMDQIFGAPQNAMERVNDVLVPTILSAGASSAGAPSLIRSLAAGPEAASQAPASFVSPTDAKKQILAQTIKKGQDLGMVVPPQTTNPGAVNAAVETVGGKIATAQGASVRNQPIANAVAAKELGLNPDAPLTPNAVKSVIGDAGKGYQALRNVGQIPTDDTYLNTLADVDTGASGPAASFPGSKVSPLVDEVKSMTQPAFDASHAVDKIAQLRDSSSMAYRAGDTQLGKGYRQLSNALEDQIDRGISQNPDISPSTVANFRASRVMAAKAHSVLDALNSSTGNVSIHSLASSEDPLTGGLKTLADFGRAAPKATQDVDKIGSPGVSHLDMLGPLLAGAVGDHAAGAWGTAAAAAYPASRWAAKAYALGPGQARAIPQIVSSAGSPKAASVATQLASGAEDSIQRASGGRVDINSLVEKLIRRWKAAKKQTDATTKPMLKLPDATVVKALDIAGRSI
jgi:hypothetical protein